MPLVAQTDAWRHRGIDGDAAVPEGNDRIPRQGPPASAIADRLYVIRRGEFAAGVVEHCFFHALPQLMSHGLRSGALPVEVWNGERPRPRPGVKVRSDFTSAIVQAL